LRIAIIAVSEQGIATARALQSFFAAADIYVPPRFIETLSSVSCAGEYSSPAGGGNTNISERSKEPEPNLKNILPLGKSFTAAVAGIFHNYDALIFVSAAAVAVRAIAPCLSGKAEDPAVVVVDEGRNFSISLLSGHLGGANELAVKVACCLGAEAVITTATDGRGLPAFDDLARRWGWSLENLPNLKHISSALLEGRQIVLYSCRPFPLPLTGNIYLTENSAELSRAQHGAVMVTNRLSPLPVSGTVPQITLRPRNVSAGVGCRRGIAAEKIVEAVQSAFSRAGLAEESLSCLATGEFKKDEIGLIEAARYLKVPLKIFYKNEIVAALGESVTSEFVREQVGVGAVAEPCAVLGSGGGHIILPVQREGGITVALAEGELFPDGIDG
jgi:cobalt-precorrin 5A hydrolase